MWTGRCIGASGHVLSSVKALSIAYLMAFNRRRQPDGLQLLVPASLRNEIMDIAHTGFT